MQQKTTLQWGLPSQLVHGLSGVVGTPEVLRSFPAQPFSCHRVPRESVKVENRRKASQKQAAALASQLLGVHGSVGQALPFPPNGASLSAQKRRKDRQVEGEVAQGLSYPGCLWQGIRWL